LAIIEPEGDAYRFMIAGEWERYWYNYGFLPSGWPAYVRTGKILDIGLTRYDIPMIDLWHFDITTSVVVMNCRDQAVFTKGAGRSGSSLFYSKILKEYEEVKKAVHFLNPLPLSIVDIRTLEQLKSGCCPKAVLIAMLAEEAL